MERGNLLGKAMEFIGRENRGCGVPVLLNEFSYSGWLSIQTRPLSLRLRFSYLRWDRAIMSPCKLCTSKARPKPGRGSVSLLFSHRI